MVAMRFDGEAHRPLPGADLILWQQAVSLSYRPYVIDVFEDELTTGGQGFVAVHPELEGCSAQGITPFEAVRDLAYVRVDYLYHLLSHDLDVPEPEQGGIAS